MENESHGATIVRLACLDDDAQGQRAEIIWDLELDTEILDNASWSALGRRGFDDPRFFSAYIHTLRWNCVTATDPRLFQSPFRAGIRVDAYQLEPLRKALLLPRVNLFIADDVGLGKTIEAGLIATELLLRRRVREIVVACPPSMLLQWKDELENRFGLVFEILDRSYIERIRQERGYGANPWASHPRFLVSHNLLIDETYAAPLRDWLDNLRPRSLLILDEAHHAAPSSGARYAIDSRFTRAIRDLASRFEHRLFLSATPHNGHSNSFSALLELLDPQRFTRGVKVIKKNLEDVMVRRLKEDIRQLAGGFPERKVVQIDLGPEVVPNDAPELVLSRLLEQYRQSRALRLSGATKRKQAEAGLLTTHLQQRLLSSVEAFARTLAVHRRTVERMWAQEQVRPPGAVAGLDLLTRPIDRDDERAQLPEEDLQTLEDLQVEAATTATFAESKETDRRHEESLLADMQRIADGARGSPDARMRSLIEWIREHMCGGVRVPGTGPPVAGAEWNDLRILIFTEWDDTKRYVVEMLRQAIAATDLAEFRIEVFHGPTPPEKREAIKRAFNLPPKEHPVRILVATDAAREGLNLQAHCYNLFHIDVPWNPSRLEQRNGRIDRKMQPAEQVFCHYFVYLDRPEDRVLRALVRKTEVIRRELGSLADVLEARLASTLQGGIHHDEIEKLERKIADESIDPEKQSVTQEELEATRERREQLEKQIDTLRGRINDAKKWIGLETEELRDALSCSLEMLGSEPLKAIGSENGAPQRYVFPNLDTRRGGDASWAPTLETLREPPDNGKRDFTWRKESPIRPVVFTAPNEIDEDVVQLHLAHRVVQRLLGRFLSQGFVHHDLSRACLAQSDDAIPRVILLGRTSLYGPGAIRLHDEMLSVAAKWIALDSRHGPLTPYAREGETRTTELLEKAMKTDRRHAIPEPVVEKLKASLERDIAELLPHLDERGNAARIEAQARLEQRGRSESESLRKILEEQKKRVAAELGKSPDLQTYLNLGTGHGPNESERRQYESNRRYWTRWLENVDGDIATEPGRILDFYKVKTARIEPVGVAYLWPITG